MRAHTQSPSYTEQLMSDRFSSQGRDQLSNLTKAPRAGDEAEGRTLARVHGVLSFTPSANTKGIRGDSTTLTDLVLTT